MRRVVATAGLLCAAPGCGDNLSPRGPDLARAAELVIVAHPGDELRHMQPDLLESIAGGGGVTIVYVTAGNGASLDRDAWRAPYRGVREAYAHATGAAALDWECGVLDLQDHPIEHCRLAPAQLSLVLLGYPEGDTAGSFEASLLRLWRGQIASSNTLGAHDTRFDREGLLATVGQLVRETAPRTLRTLDVGGLHGAEHADHRVAGALALAAHARASSQAELLAYRADSARPEPANLAPAWLARALPAIARLEACTSGCAACGEACREVAPATVEAVSRRYAVGFRARGGGRLRAGNRCLDDGLAQVSCEAAPVWQLDDAGELRTRDLCLASDGEGALAMRPCIGGVQRRFYVDDDGHVVAGSPPPADATATGDEALLWCLGTLDGKARLARCAASGATRWELVPEARATTRASLGLVASGRDVRLGDLTGDGKADLCAVEPGAGLRCAAGDGHGGFATAVRLDAAVAPLAIDPRSLVLGDVDADGRGDACGRDADGVLCATAASAYGAARWSSAFADATARASTSASLAATDADADGVAELCGVDASGVVCAGPGLDAELLSSWPAADAVVWLADLDGDARADWCAATAAGPACGVAAQREVSTDGVPWGFSIAGAVDIAPATTSTVALADVDADDRADLCATRDDRVVCARSQGRGFGPRATTLAILPEQSVASALWLGDLDGDGRADPCVDAGPSIVCAVQP